MGYIVPGYSSRRLRYYKETLVYYPCFKRVRLLQGLRFESLPAEILQRVFVFSGNGKLAEVNKRFWEVLKPRKHLVEWFLGEYYIEKNEGGVKILSEEVFKRRVLLKYMYDDGSILKEIRGVTGRAQGDRNELLDFPSVLYNRPQIFFWHELEEKADIDNQFLVRLQDYYVLRQPEYLAERLMQWFFYKNQGEYKIEHLFQAVHLCLRLAGLHDARFGCISPLVALLDHLYLGAVSDLSVLLLATPSTLDDCRKCVVEKFAFDFYRNRENLLCYDILWSRLYEIDDSGLIKGILKLGGRPSFNVVQ